MTVTDENKRSLAYNPELYEVAVQGMAMKARWVARKLRKWRRTRWWCWMNLTSAPSARHSSMCREAT